MQARVKKRAVIASRVAGLLSARAPGKLRRRFLTEPLLYQAYVRASRKTGRAALPQRGDHVYIDGYPRSANTYTVNLIRHFFPDVKMAHHLHTVAALKIALKLGVPSVVLIRPPLEAVASYAYRRHHRPEREVISDALLDRLIDDYVLYYRGCQQLRAELKFVHFASVTASPLEVMSTVLPPALVDQRAHDFSEEELERYTTSLRDRNRRKTEKKAGTNSLPAPETAGEKQGYAQRIEQRRGMAEAIALYEALAPSAV